MTVEETHKRQALSLGPDRLVGRFRCDLATQRWTWSDETFRIHGFEPGDVVPTTTLVLAHKHPDDRDRVSRILGGAARTGDPFSSVHRIMDARGRERTLAMVGQGRPDPGSGQVRELAGYFVDITAEVETRANESASAAIRASSASRATIEQAKGIIAFALSVDVEEAFEHLRRASNLANIPVRDIARRLVEVASVDRVSAVDVASFLTALSTAAGEPGPAQA